jgi:hypothetical protein
VDLRCLGVPAFHRLVLALIEGLAELGRLEREDPYLLFVDLELLGKLLGLDLEHRGLVADLQRLLAEGADRVDCGGYRGDLAGQVERHGGDDV